MLNFKVNVLLTDKTLSALDNILKFLILSVWLYAKTIEENKTSKRLIVELLKENEKIKLEKEIFKNKLLEIENKELKEEIESAVADKGVNKFLVLLFFTFLILLAYGVTSLIISIFQSSFRKGD